MLRENLVGQGDWRVTCLAAARRSRFAPAGSPFRSYTSARACHGCTGTGSGLSVLSDARVELSQASAERQFARSPPCKSPTFHPVARTGAGGLEEVNRSMTSIRHRLSTPSQLAGVRISWPTFAVARFSAN